MTETPLDPRSNWAPLTQDQVGKLCADAPIRWWLSGGHALDRWLGEPIRERRNIDVSVVYTDAAAFVEAVRGDYEVWAQLGDPQVGDERLVPYDELPEGSEVQPVLLRDTDTKKWVLRINLEDGAPKLWVYKRDPRLTLTWDKAIHDIDGIPTGAPEVQILWKALRPRPEDDTDKDAVLPKLDDTQRAFWEKAILSIHPHSSWSIHVRSPFAPAKASWNRSRQR